ncbi:pyruvate dehydrogenase (acetyl-transferring) E1 component subunit alpha [Streptomyces sp. NPDC008137]|uniref:pyruvate dehydrogenase (acetyl-transferring) E1 component subunit alpha n=1 Tax=Streptomyces sp. NPDC008137 TaxID=3364813 RepID=UPI0036F0CD01
MSVARPTRTRKEPAAPRPGRRSATGKRSASSRSPASRSAAGHRTDLLAAMLRIRRFEERCVELYSAAKIRGFVHLYIGEEAVAVGVNEALTPEDSVVSTYREHGHALARGVTAEAVMAEMYGRTSGCSGGRGGSMHLFDASHRFYGGNAIVAGGIPLAAGLALADRMRGENRVTCCFFGDGAFAEGEFHETANLATLWNLPLLFVCENNRYAMGTALERHEAQTDLAMRAASYGMVAWAVDGMDVEAVERAARRAAEGISNGNGPHFLELRTYRFRAHSMYDPDRYRDKEEVEKWRSRDPIGLLADRMREGGELGDKELERIEQRVTTEVDRAVDAAEQAPEEPVGRLLRHVTSSSAEEG